MYDILALSARYIFIFVAALIVLSIIGIQKVQDKERERLQASLKQRYNEKDATAILFIKNTGESKSRVWEIELGDQTTIGRGNDNSVILQDAAISKNHAAIIKKDSRYYLQDLNSTNGTYINGKKIKKAVKLDDSSVILIGPFELRMAQQSDK